MSRGFERNRWLTFHAGAVRRRMRAQGRARHAHRVLQDARRRRSRCRSPAERGAQGDPAAAVASPCSTSTRSTACLRRWQRPRRPMRCGIRIDEAERLIVESGAIVRHGGSRAFYAPGEDYIQMPPRSAFGSASDYYATSLHELTHWTGHPDRCYRPLGRRHGIDAYAFEELIAEMGAAFLTNHCRLPGKLQHESYIASWLAGAAQRQAADLQRGLARAESRRLPTAKTDRSRGADAAGRSGLSSSSITKKKPVSSGVLMARICKRR